MTETYPTTADSVSADGLGFDLREANQMLDTLSAEQRVTWALDCFAGGVVMSSSFGKEIGRAHV